MIGLILAVIVFCVFGFGYLWMKWQEGRVLGEQIRWRKERERERKRRS